MSISKADLAAAMAAFEQQGGKVDVVAEGVKSADLDSANTTLMYCSCGCHGDYTEHSMRAGEGKFADQ